MTEAVTPGRIRTASNFLDNAGPAALACRKAKLPYFAACALLDQESEGRNVYGSDKGGALAGFPFEVNLDNFRVFRWMVLSMGQRSNGVGPCQITYKGYFNVMQGRGLQPWVPHDNMLFGFELLQGNYLKAGKSWARAGAIYNGGPNPNATALGYGRDFAAKVALWKDRLGIR